MFIRRRRSAMYSNEKSNNDREIMSLGTAVRLTKKVRQTGNTHEVVARRYVGDGKLQHILC